MVEAWVLETVDKMSKLWKPVKGLNSTAGAVHDCNAWLVDEELVRVLSVVTAALKESGVMFIEAICDVCVDFPVDSSSDALGISVGTLLVMLKSLSLYAFSFFLI